MFGSRNEVVVFNLQTEYECLTDITVIHHLYILSNKFNLMVNGNSGEINQICACFFYVISDF